MAMAPDRLCRATACASAFDFAIAACECPFRRQSGSRDCASLETKWLVGIEGFLLLPALESERQVGIHGQHQHRFGQRFEPTPRVRASIAVQFPEKLELDATVRYVSALPAQAVEAYTTADLRFGWRRRPEWEVSLVGQNLLQPRHPEFGADVNTIVGIKRAAYMKITWNTGKR